MQKGEGIYMDEKQDNLPYIPDAVIIYLEKIYPNETPMEEKSQFQYGKAAGCQEVIQHLKTIKKWSEEKDV